MDNQNLQRKFLKYIEDAISLLEEAKKLSYGCTSTMSYELFLPKEMHIYLSDKKCEGFHKWEKGLHLYKCTQCSLVIPNDTFYPFYDYKLSKRAKYRCYKIFSHLNNINEEDNIKESIINSHYLIKSSRFEYLYSNPPLVEIYKCKNCNEYFMKEIRCNTNYDISMGYFAYPDDNIYKYNINANDLFCNNI